MSTPELKPCPFCGAVPELVEYTEMDNKPAFSIDCGQCDMAGTAFSYSTMEPCVEAWNRRTSSDAALRDAVRAEAAKLCEQMGDEWAEAAMWESRHAAYDCAAKIRALSTSQELQP